MTVSRNFRFRFVTQTSVPPAPRQSAKALSPRSGCCARHPARGCATLREGQAVAAQVTRASWGGPVRRTVTGPASCTLPASAGFRPARQETGASARDALTI